jgi:hypothetical protein
MKKVKLLLLSMFLLTFISCTKEEPVEVFQPPSEIRIITINAPENLLHNDSIFVKYVINSLYNIKTVTTEIEDDINRIQQTIQVKDTVFRDSILIYAESYNIITCKISAKDEKNIFKVFTFQINVTPPYINDIVEYNNIILATYEYSSAYDYIVADNCYSVNENKTYFSQSPQAAHNSQNIDFVYARGKIYSPRRFKSYYYTVQPGYSNPQLSIDHWYHFNNTKLINNAVTLEEFDLIRNDSLLIIYDSFTDEQNENGFVTYALNEDDIILFKTVGNKIGIIKVLEQRNPKNILINGYLQFTTGYIKLHVKIQL